MLYLEKLNRVGLLENLQLLNDKSRRRMEGATEPQHMGYAHVLWNLRVSSFSSL